MKVVADESVEFEVINALRQNNISVYSIAELHAGIPDEEVLEIANEQACLLITEDKDFGELTYRLNKTSHGILLLRILNVFDEQKAAMVLKTLKTKHQQMLHSFSVLSNRKLRIKPI